MSDKSSNRSSDTEVSRNTIGRPSGDMCIDKGYKTRWWTGTSFKTNDNFGRRIEKAIKHKKLRYIVWQQERCPKTDKLHMQFTCYFNNAVTYKRLKEIFGNKVHVEGCKNIEACINYCKKPETRVDGPWEEGEAPNPGKRMDLIATRDFIQKYGLLAAMENDDTSSNAIRYSRAFEKMLELKHMETQRDWETEVILLIGPPGVGKTSKIKELYPDAYWKDHSKWWNGYQGQEVVIFDDMDWSKFTFERFKVFANHNPLQIEVKGGKTQFLAKTIIIVDNYEPQEWWQKADGRSLIHKENEAAYAAFWKRVKKVWKIDDTNLPKVEERIKVPEVEMLQPSAFMKRRYTPHASVPTISKDQRHDNIDTSEIEKLIYDNIINVEE